ncbi:MAG: DNA cytosine methyltransferase [Kofleriaceae bacterium]
MSRRPVITASFAFPGELVVDLFAGGGGASTGLEAALRRPVDIAINHDPAAIAMHKANHPETRHFIEDIWAVDPREACGSRSVAVLWASPDCTDHSRAKGSKPRAQGKRVLADAILRWARTVKPKVILLENVEEWLKWGPLDERGFPIKAQEGESFRAWRAALVDCGYTVEHRSLVAADYGTPTTRKRLYLIARIDRAPIVWPEPTHGKGRPHAWRPAAEVIDWTIPCPSIFGRRKPLAEATLRRIATGIRRYVVENGDPFIIPVTHHGDARVHDIQEPVRTVTGAHRGELALVEPFVVRHGHYSTITGAGLRDGCGAGTFRGQSLRAPIATVCATNDKHLVVPFIAKHYGGPQGHQTPGADARHPLGTVTAKDHNGLCAAFVSKFYGTSTGSAVQLPLPTVTSGGGRGGGHLAEVRAFLIKYYGSAGRPQGQQLGLPLGTVTAHDRFGLVMLHGEPWQIVDIGMRMLTPRELFAAQGFPADYEIEPEFNGRPLSKTEQTAKAGNSVCPPVAEALVRANIQGAA